MNKQRRNKLNELYAELEYIKNRLNEISEDEENALASMPESFSETERYERMSECADQINDAVMAVDEAMELITAAVE